MQPRAYEADVFDENSGEICGKEYINEATNISNYIESKISGRGGLPLRFNGWKFMEVRKQVEGDYATIYGKKGRVAICVCNTKQTIIVGQNDGMGSAVECNAAVEALAAYLTGRGF
jgi:hypothetical protein